MDFPIDPPTLKSITSLFFGKKEKKPPMQTPPPPPLEPGLKTLTTPITLNRSLSCKKPNILSFSSSSSSLSSLSSPPSPSPSSCPLMDEPKYHEKEREVPCHVDIAIGNANGIGIEKEKEEKPRAVFHGRYRRRRSFQEEKEYPPPIPLLARTGNLPCHMPWVLKRSYIDNGRLIIQEVKVKHHEFFRAHRANGRLTLQIVQLDESATLLRQKPESSNPNGRTDETSENGKEGEEKDKPKKHQLHSLAPSSSSSSSPSLPSLAKNTNTSHIPSMSPSLPSLAKNTNTSHIPSMSPSSLPPQPSMLSKELKSMLDPNRCSTMKKNLSMREEKNVRDVMETGTLPSILSSSMPESSFGISGGNAGGWFMNKRSNSLFQMPIPTIRPVHS
ncbi:uncharacterized protein LOC131238022 [Magnolia sinica]|uniref:uncharacterized protein LOC131238022 n=1 Tax=Magnolia sinica TaxID=86752 RepID=UPI00265A5914|nr:uncharacterized protein LOC131238022 [Magnolia sinica]